MRKSLFAAAIFAAAVALTTGAARADDLSFHSSDGPMYIHVGRNSGRVSGEYQQDTGARRQGQLLGNVGPDGNLHGVWLQAESDHPCSRPREGTLSWGQFVIMNPWGRDPYGAWGYCGEQPNRSWNLERR